MLKKTLILAVAATVTGAMSASADVPAKPTFTKDVLPILQENCQTCHRPSGQNLSGMVAPMSLITYREVRPWAKSIAKSVQEKTMPPWTASESFHGVFKNERTLTKDEISTIVKWVVGNAPRGNIKDAPEPITFPATGWNFGEPDMVVEFDEPYFVADEIEDLYHNVTVKIPEEILSEDRWISEIQFRPGSEVVHHIIGYALPEELAGAASGVEGANTRGMLGGMAPGTEHGTMPDGYGLLLPKGSSITFAMHYHKESGPGTGMMDLSSIGMKFHPKGAKIEHPIDISTIAHGAFEIPPGVSDWRVGASRTFREGTMLLSMMPHMHLRGKSSTYTAFYPDGTSELLLDVPAYDFNWQTQYDLAEIKFLPAGTRIEMDFVFDNSSELAEAIGFNSDRAIRFGGPTTDEMDLAWITIAPANPVTAQSGD